MEYLPEKFSFVVWLGRQLVGQLSGLHNVHELYTISVGLYACWCLMKLGILASEWLPRGWNHMADGVKMTLTVVRQLNRLPERHLFVVGNENPDRFDARSCGDPVANRYLFPIVGRVPIESRKTSIGSIVPLARLGNGSTSL